ncbi:MAG: hypothetical protein KAS32_09825 [Candidatus Peribacteraceae bacterium]|nr:hypothetical protein [Candidatus Peribacteraceae bacterium]
MKKLILAILLTASLFSDSIIVPVTSMHLDSEYSHNEDNAGLGYKYLVLDHIEIEDGLYLEDGVYDIYLSAGFYENSIYRTSVFVAAGYDYILTEYLQVGVEVGAVSGYTDTGFIPYARPTATVRFYENLSCKLGFIPKTSPERSSVLTLEFLVDF